MSSKSSKCGAWNIITCPICLQSRCVQIPTSPTNSICLFTKMKKCVNIHVFQKCTVEWKAIIHKHHKTFLMDIGRLGQGSNSSYLRLWCPPHFAQIDILLKQDLIQMMGNSATLWALSSCVQLFWRMLGKYYETDNVCKHVYSSVWPTLVSEVVRSQDVWSHNLSRPRINFAHNEFPSTSMNIFWHESHRNIRWSKKYVWHEKYWKTGEKEIILVRNISSIELVTAQIGGRRHPCHHLSLCPI